MEQPKRFKVGDQVTYKKYPYYYGGCDEAGFVGEIIAYGYFNPMKLAWEIEVMCSDGTCNTMLESEFEEWDVKPEVKEFKWGDYIVVLRDKDSDSKYIKHGYVFIQGRDKTSFDTDKSLDGKRTSTDSIAYSKPSSWRYATPEEIAAYDKAGKPVDVITIRTPESADPHEELMERAKRDYPIGTVYKPISREGLHYHLEARIQRELRWIAGKNIEGGPGYVYVSGKWAEIVEDSQAVAPKPQVPDTEALLKEAKLRYPPGTNYAPAHLSSKEETCTAVEGDELEFFEGIIQFSSGNINKNGHSYSEVVYTDGKWAEIIKKEEPVAPKTTLPVDFRNCKIRTPTPVISAQVQTDLFKLGFYWGSSKEQTLLYTESPFLYTETTYLSYGSTGSLFAQQDKVEVTPEELRAYVAARFEVPPSSYDSVVMKDKAAAIGTAIHRGFTDKLESRPIPTGIGIMEQIKDEFKYPLRPQGVQTWRDPIYRMGVDPYQPEPKNPLHKEFDIKPLQLTTSINKPKRRKVTL